MHLQFRAELGLDETATAVDLGHAPADLLFLSFADSELAALRAAQGPGHPSLRIADLGRLRHPLSVDLYLERTAAGARAIVVRLLGGLDYWRYGAEEIAALARGRGIPLALLPGDNGADERLAALSTMAPETLALLADCFRHGGARNMGLALDLAAQAAGLGPQPAAGVEVLPPFGDFPLPPAEGEARALIVFYRSHRLAGDTAMVTDLAAALAGQGLVPAALHVASLKDGACAAFVEARIAALAPAVVLNLTGFSARLGDAPSPLDAAGVPVLQLLCGSNGERAWAGSSRGLGAADLAMQVVLPELDGRLSGGLIAFKERDEAGEARHRPSPSGIAMAAARAAAWARLAAKAPAERRLALVLSDYPGVGGQAGHAVGLDSFASAGAILADLAAAGYDTTTVTAEGIAAALTGAPAAFLPLAAYEILFAGLPAPARARVLAAWGPAADDPAVADGAFRLPLLSLGRVTVALQPDRGRAAGRKAEFHDPDLPPRHIYVAFYLWLRHRLGIDALIHLGTHGTLEWLPGKAVALDEACFPAALAGPLPVVYPFIVNNPGEAAQAKRRLGAVTIGHLTPPLRRAGLHGEAEDLERLIDEFAAADGLDPRRSRLLKREILDRAGAAGLLAESGIAPGTDDDTALARLDAWLCDVKDLQIRDGLHVFGRPAPGLRHLRAALPAGAALDPCAEGERRGLLAALDGRFVEPGPAGAPTRGRADVLPTGRNLYTIDPRAVPNRSALVLAEKAAAALIERYLQDHGDWPRRLVLDLWGSATMRTGGEDLALALLLIGARPLWDEGSARVAGTEILPLATLGRPRVDVTLRISGLFRDAFAAQIALFDQAVQAIARRDEDAAWNPLAATARALQGAEFRRATTRIYGAAPGSYGAGVTGLTDAGGWQDRADLGRDYIARGGAAFGLDLDGTADAAGFADRLRSADALVHGLDHGEIDIFESTDVAAHMGGFAAAGRPGAALYLADQRDPDRPRLRPLRDEIARVTRGRAANPRWIAGMMRHGYRGAAEIARTVEPLFVFAATLAEPLDAQFDLLFAATLGDEAVDRFLADTNPAARAAMTARFAEARARGLWHPRRNDVAARIEGGA
ncbi:cobaltochelatase subunit CobN [Zavarzinia compransoris]|uniref:Cobaltochelatase subunit CobN n=1 Tax=Zavarzinia compransoris TaxID=1264899 RepID=A0A317E3G9_9PROT|nr:cobaltochelatase subunit CobN [Zavarzinia compransoris]PWR19615.1 cobaltochelatase subunit CobN [Zavarzinia compransoris]TDP40400.1 cobaltochelatase CobN [Zavarzinia compransoris]